MDELHKQVRRTQWRLATQRFLGLLGWYWFALLLVAAGLIALGKYWPLGVADWVWPVAALGLGLAIAAAWTFFSRRRALAAAIELDRRCGLKERVASTLSLTPAERESEIGQALVADAVRRVARVEVAEQFAVVLPRQTLLAFLPGAAALLIALLVPPAATENPADAKTDPPAVQRQVKRSTEELQRRLAERRKEAEKLDLKDAERLFKRLEEGAKDLDPQKNDRKSALVKLNDLSRELQARRQQLGGADEAKKQLEQLKSTERGPAEKFAQAVSKGDVQQALKELEKLKEQLDKSQLGDEQKQQLAKQLEQMKDKLQKTAEARQAAQADLEKRINQARQAGDNDGADKLQEQLENMLKNMPQLGQLDNLAEKLGECAKCLRDGQNAQQAMADLEAGLNKLGQQLEEMDMLDEAMQQLADARQKMNEGPCPACGGEGCEKCGGKGLGQGMGDGDGEGDGLGRGQGRGDRPEKPNDTKFYDSTVRQKLGPGAADVTGTVSGPNIRGNVAQEIEAQMEEARQGASDPLSGRRLPRKHRAHAQEYFDRLREGKP